MILCDVRLELSEHPLAKPLACSSLDFKIKPYLTNDKQQLQRKRHVGNDMVCIVFQEEVRQRQVQWVSGRTGWLVCH